MRKWAIIIIIILALLGWLFIHVYSGDPDPDRYVAPSEIYNSRGF